MTYVAHYVRWCWQEAGVELVTTDVFTPALINYFTGLPSKTLTGNALSAREHSDRRAVLLAMSASLGVSAADNHTPASLRDGTVTAPYTATELGGHSRL